MSSREERRRRPDRWLFAAFVLLLLWLPLPSASHSVWATALMGMAVFLLLSWWGILLAAGRVSWPLRIRRLVIPLVLWGLWLAWIAVQIVPLSPTWLAWLSPPSFFIHQGVAALDGVQPLYSISIAPGDTCEKLAESLIYFGIYLLTFLLLRGDSRLRTVLLALLISGLAQAVFASTMTLSGLEYGFFEKKTAYLGSATGTFVNRNHLAAYLEMTAAAGIGLVLADMRGTSQWNWKAALNGLLDLMLSTRLRVRLALVIIAIGLMLTRSRMGNLAFFGSLSLCGLSYVVLRERQYFFKALMLFASILLIDVLIVNQWFGLERVIERIEATRVESESRIQLLAEVGPVMAAYRMTGAGLGSFAYAYEPYRSESMRAYMNHAHNDYVEFMVETGAIGCGLLLLLVAVHVLHALKVITRRRHRLRIAACFTVIMATTALAIHATAEFNFQIPADAATYVVLLGLAASCSSRSRRRPRELAHGTSVPASANPASA